MRAAGSPPPDIMSMAQSQAGRLTAMLRWRRMRIWTSTGDRCTWRGLDRSSHLAHTTVGSVMYNIGSNLIEEKIFSGCRVQECSTLRNSTDDQPCLTEGLVAGCCGASSSYGSMHHSRRSHVITWLRHAWCVCDSPGVLQVNEPT